MIWNFEFFEFKKFGVYVIDFIGSGKSSWVVICKGKFWYFVENMLVG